MANPTLTTLGSPVTVSLRDLQTDNIPFAALEEAFGPSSLGILVVTDLPGEFAFLRSRVLANSSRLAALPKQKLQTLTNPHAKYLVGWSHGVETLRPGVIDTQKGSYYINCAFYQDPKLQGANGEKFPGFEEYTAPNVWPAEEDVPDFRAAAEALIILIIDTAGLVARACDRYAEDKIAGYTKGYLEKVVRSSETTKARLLHYFPKEDKPPAEAATTNGEVVKEAEAEADDDWCATHLDHGCLTGLTSAMFVDEAATPPTSSSSTLTELAQSPDPRAGLYIRSRTDTTVKVNIPRASLAFQTGEALERITQGKFRAVPHFVRGAAPQAGAGGSSTSRIARNTLAVFTQPNLDDVVDLRDGTTFGEFARGVVNKNTADVEA